MSRFDHPGGNWWFICWLEQQDKEDIAQSRNPICCLIFNRLLWAYSDND